MHLPPRPLALLAYLAVAEPVGMHRRDKLASLLWPDQTQVSARNALRQSLTVLRKAFGPHLVQTTGLEEVGVAHSTLRVDVQVFRSLVHEKRWNVAVPLFTGLLLDGLHLSQAQGFMEWLDQTRNRLDRAYRGAMEGSARACEEQADWEAALEWWSRLLEVEPVNVRVACGLVRSQAAAGDPVGALQRAELSASTIREEADVDPAPELQRAFAEGCRAWRSRRDEVRQES
jgi:DNA-binding SARP family transcriptional activator